jgi:hypothetical protein
VYYNFVVVGADNADASYENIKPSVQEQWYDETKPPVQDDEFLEPISLVQDKRNDDTKPPVQDKRNDDTKPPVQEIIFIRYDQSRKIGNQKKSSGLRNNIQNRIGLPMLQR